MNRSLEVVRLVTVRELRERARTKSFISTIITAALLLAAVVVPSLLADDDAYVIGLVGDYSPPVRAALEGVAASPDGGAELRTFADEGAAEEAVEDETIDLAVANGDEIIVQELDTGSQSGQLATRAAATIAVYQRLEAAGLDPARAAEALAGPPLPVRSLEPSGAEQDRARALVYVVLFLIYLSTVGYGTYVLLGVVEEKSTRVVEVLLPAVRPHQLMAGKVIGIGALGLSQLIVVSLPALIAARLLDTPLPEGSGLTIAAGVMWFLLAYAFYAALYAAGGALASRQEEAQNVSFPMTAFLIAGFVVGIQALGSPDSALVKVLSFVPPFAPMTMLPRATLADVAVWEVPASVALTLVGSYLVVRLAGRIYSGAILRTGPRVKLTEALRSAKG